MSLVSYNFPALPTALWLPVPAFVLVTNQRRDELRDNEGGPEFSAMPRAGGRRTLWLLLCDAAGPLRAMVLVRL
jgi:hypothetical protein